MIERAEPLQVGGRGAPDSKICGSASRVTWYSIQVAPAKNAGSSGAA